MFTITLSMEELRVIGAALQELPFKVASPLITNIDAQVQPQANPVVAEPEATEAE